MEIDPVKFGVTWQKVEAMEYEVAELHVPTTGPVE